jgi:hypothetical protein
MTAFIAFAALSISTYADGPSLPAGLDVASISSLARSVMLESLPERVEERRDWGKQTNIPTMKFRGQGLKTRVEKLDKSVNHGTWKHYIVEPIDPQSRLTLDIEDLQALPDGGFAFDLRVSAPVKAQATVHQWAYGVRVLAVTVEADAEATAALRCEVRTTVTPGTILPTVTLSPVVASSEIDVTEFKLRKIGELPRAVARELNGEAKRIVVGYIRKNEGKLAAKANAALEKKSKAGKFTFSPIPLVP